METATQERRYGSIEDFNSKNSNKWDKRYIFVLNHQMGTPSIVGKHFPDSYSIPLEDQIFDSTIQKSRVIRVVPGEQSIFRDEQSEDGQKARHINKIFSKKGDLIVEAKEEQTLKFLMMSNKNGSNPNRDKNVIPLYYLFDSKQGMEMEISNYKAEAEALNWCYSDTTKFKHLLRYARVLGANTNEDADLIRHQMANLAKKDPQKFLDGLKNKYTVRKFYVLEAVEKNILTVDLRSNTIQWSNGHIICNAPVGKSPVDHFVDMSVSDATFDMTYRDIQERVEPTVEKVAPKKEPKYEAKTESIIEKPVQELLSEKPNMLDVTIATDDLIKKACKCGVITRKSSWFIYLGKNYQGAKMNEAIEQDAILKESIIRACNEFQTAGEKEV